MEDFKSIFVTEGIKKVDVIKNPTLFPLIGNGAQGAVFKITSIKCVKICAKPEYAAIEGNVLKMAQESPTIPRLYEVGHNYIIMEYLEGPTLFQYLESGGILSENLMGQILFVLNEMKRLKFTRMDADLRHIIVTKEEELKVIDHYSSYTRIRNKPELIFKGLKKLGLLPLFLEKLKEMDPESYMEWKDL
ncbi:MULTISPECIES: kinase [unclassified Bacillus (in: firmicutes)]|uniref:kinase n=1 Tax=unclassified Bacillus (in: firmicutes) TaxID=185979 RepID=UPI001BE94298|nr:MULTISPECIES: kinase [unclassified Bacillus (in: firmicutes)]MBT2617100.1 kinase [Bacillus sp. ISL-78]MBT2629027.1 kinase [Bacillus sp. ISL-101]MBT2717470.1 kinase [Bacillus sp. ISL-57]